MNDFLTGKRKTLPWHTEPFQTWLYWFMDGVNKIANDIIQKNQPENAVALSLIRNLSKTFDMAREAAYMPRIPKAYKIAVIEYYLLGNNLIRYYAMRDNPLALKSTRLFRFGSTRQHRCDH